MLSGNDSFFNNVNDFNSLCIRHIAFSRPKGIPPCLTINLSKNSVASGYYGNFATFVSNKG